MVTLAGVVPDIDGLGVIVELLTCDRAHPLLWWSEYHHVLGHNLGGVLVVTIAVVCLAPGASWRRSGLALAPPISRQGRDKIGDGSYLFNTCTRHGVLLARCKNVAEAPISSRIDRYLSVQRPA